MYEKVPGSHPPKLREVEQESRHSSFERRSVVATSVEVVSVCAKREIRDAWNSRSDGGPCESHHSKRACIAFWYASRVAGCTDIYSKKDIVCSSAFGSDDVSTVSRWCRTRFFARCRCREPAGVGISGASELSSSSESIACSLFVISIAKATTFSQN